VALLRPAKGERGGIEPEAVVIPRRMWRGGWPSVSAEVQSVWAESCTSEAETSRRMEVAVQRGHPSERWVQFGVVDDRQGARHGHSGGPVLELGRLSPRPRLVGVVRARDEQTRDLLDGAGAGWLVPVERIAERFGEVAALVETPIERSGAWRMHWEPRSRGVVNVSEEGFFYTGYHRAYERVRAHFASEEAGLLVVTGQRARGKSALLARVGVLSCVRYVTLLGEQAEPAVAGYARLSEPLDAAVFARAKNVDALASEIARQLGL
jgi:hypothetical protein